MGLKLLHAVRNNWAMIVNQFWPNIIEVHTEIHAPAGHTAGVGSPPMQMLSTE